MTYRSSRNSSMLTPDCLRMSERVPRANSVWSGTTVLKTRSDVRFSSDTWLPSWRNSMKPARFRARTTRSPETLGSFGISMGDFHGGPESFSVGGRPVRNPPSFEVQLNRLTQVCPSALYVFSLRGDVQLRAARYIPAVVLGDQGGESVGHTPMLTDVESPSKARSPLQK